MKRILLSAVLTLAATAGAAFATPTSTTRADIPYDFVANGVEMPAGQYDLQISLTQVRLSSADGKRVVLLPASQLRPIALNTTTGIFLKREGSRMRLVAVREAGSGYLRVLGAGY